MTEAEWLACDDPYPLMRVFRANPSRRKFRLFTCACCRRVWASGQITPESRAVHAVDLAERVADGLASDEDRRERVRAINAELGTGPIPSDSTTMALAALGVGTLRLGRSVAGFASHLITQHAEAAWVRDVDSPERREAGRAAALVEGQAQAGLIRDIFGNPFRAVALDPSWLTSTVVSLAEGIYADRAFDRLPILADALQDAGCEVAEVLDHCRGPGPHARGCWVVDLVLGKA
jgi:hypothetical protein